MTATAELPGAPSAEPSRDVLRRNVVDRLDDLSDQELRAFHDALLRSMKQRLWQEISSDAGEDHRSGLMHDLPRYLNEARESIRARA